jgi:putative ABC transport system ATP-binding protein
LIIVTHDIEIASYADRIVHILDGNIEKIEIANKIGRGSNEETDSALPCLAAADADI